MGDVQSPPLELKSELTKPEQPPLDVEIDQCRKYISRAQKRIKASHESKMWHQTQIR